jgi:putative transposase
LIEAGHPKLSIRNQCRLLSVPRSSYYYKPKEESEENQKIMKVMDAHLLEHPTEGVKSMEYLLRDQGYTICHKRVRRLLRLMGHEAIYKKRNLSKLGHRQYIHPYLLRGLGISASNQVWSVDITYIPMARGHLYMTGIMDVFSRKIVGWNISNTLEAKSVKSVLEAAIASHRPPEIINSDQGSQFTCPIWIEYLSKEGIKISMDGKGRATDNAWIERFWKSLKHDHIYLNPAENCTQLKKGVQEYINYYHHKIHHSTREKPFDRYSKSLPKIAP